MSTPTITPTSPAMRLLLDSLDRAEDSLKDETYGFCWDCEQAADRSVSGEEDCETHQAAKNEAGRVKALRGTLGRAKDAGEVAAILAGTGVAL